MSGGSQIKNPVSHKLTPRNPNLSVNKATPNYQKSSFLNTVPNLGSSPNSVKNRRGGPFKMWRTIMIHRRMVGGGATFILFISLLALSRMYYATRESETFSAGEFDDISNASVKASMPTSLFAQSQFFIPGLSANERPPLPLMQYPEPIESRIPMMLNSTLLMSSYAPPLPPQHPCGLFTIPPPPPGKKKKSGFRPCPVCYLPVEEAIASEPRVPRDEGLGLRNLTFATAQHPSERRAEASGLPPKFGGYPSWEDRKESFRIRESMEVHCGFVWGERPGVGTGYDISDADRRDMDKCDDIVVASAIFGAYDLLQQPSNVSATAAMAVCFFMFVDEESLEDLRGAGTVPQEGSQKVGLWRIVLVKNVPYKDPRRTGKIPKLLMHRLFPNARFSIWMDAKLKLVVDPYQVLERFLWRGGASWAISRHYKRFDAFVEAEANKAAGKYDNASIDEQMEVYRKDGLTPYSEEKLPIISDVPEGCLIIREHTPVTNLFSCLWFNEVDRFTSRDQLCFGYTRDQILQQVPWKYSMFQDCERRNFVVQGYHKDVLLEKMAATGPPPAHVRKKKKHKRFHRHKHKSKSFRPQQQLK